MEEIDIPQYFLCPISLQIMKDPVTTVTGITYDRESIEQWLSTAEEASCPVTKQPLPRDSDLTPNHMLLRLIQAWCVTNAKSGVDRIPTPKSPIHKSIVFKLIRALKNPLLCFDALRKMNDLAKENEKNCQVMAEAGVAKAMILFVLKCFNEGKTLGLEESLRILHVIWKSTNEKKQLFVDVFELIQVMLWILRIHDIDNGTVLKTYAVIVLKMVIEVANPGLIERLMPDFLREMVRILRNKISQRAIKAALQVLIEVCPLGRNKIKIVESGAVFELIDIELENPDKKTSELIFCLLAQLCSCADGRQQLLKHAGGIPVVSKRLLRISPATDDSSLHIIALLAQHSGTFEVLMEMLRVGTVSKLCMMLQADCEAYLKKKAMEILRLHSNVWSHSPCIQVYLLTRNPR